MRLSAKAEYACIALMELAASREQPGPVRIRQIARTQGIPERFLVQILLALKTVGLVESTRGAQGGYRLARSPEQISLAEIVDAIDGRPAPHRSPEGGQEGSSLARALCEIWKDVARLEREYIEKTSLADLLARAQEVDVPMYQI